MKQLQFITHHTEKYSYMDSAYLALEGGCKWIQLRMKDEPHISVLETAINMKALCKQYDAVLIIDDHVSIAASVEADGVHLGKNDMPVPEARKLLGPGFLIGGTANTFEDLKRLASQGIDYAGIGPFRYTQTKKNLSPILGINGYREIIKRCQEVGISIPFVAIGGITSKDIPELIHAGVPGIALSGAILQAENPTQETRKFIQLLNQ